MKWCAAFSIFVGRVEVFRWAVSQEQNALRYILSVYSFQKLLLKRVKWELILSLHCRFFGCHTVFVSNMNSYFEHKKQFFSHPFIVMYYIYVSLDVSCIFSAHFTMMSKVHVTCMMCFIARLQRQHRVWSTIFFSNFQYPKKGSKTVRNVVFLSCLTSENINGREILGLG